jgi:hypothetical protein
VVVKNSRNYGKWANAEGWEILEPIAEAPAAFLWWKAAATLGASPAIMDSCHS